MSELPKISELKPEEMRAMCAGACGWRIGKKRFKRINGFVTGKRWEHNTKPCGFGGGAFGFDYNEAPAIRTLPSYHESLDAMAEAEATLTDEEERIYFDSLIDMRPLGAIRATAIQRLAAFLIAKGLAQP